MTKYHLLTQDGRALCKRVPHPSQQLRGIPAHTLYAPDTYEDELCGACLAALDREAGVADLVREARLDAALRLSGVAVGDAT